MSQSKPRCPHYRKLVPYVYRALQDLGGSGTNSEIRDSVIALMGLSDDIVDLPHTGKASQNNELDYQLGWTRTRLREKGWIANSARGTWIISEGPETTDIDEIRRRFNEAANGEVSAPKNQVGDSPAGEETENGEEGGQQQAFAFEQEYEEPWLEELKAILHEMSPYAFERLAGYLLRECGFVQVEVTKKSGDGGIDGLGKLKVNGLLSFNVAFQCKRYVGSVGAGEIRDFKGSLTTDVEKGLFITTGNFTKAARDEAAKQGTKQIDLMDGEELLGKLIELEIGIHPVKAYKVDKRFFENL